LVPFLSPFLCGTTKKWHPYRHTERAKLCEAVEEVVKILVNPSKKKNKNPRLQPELEGEDLIIF